jgi:hypothetical protein
MNGMEDMLNQLFRDKPIAQESLWSMRDGIMDQILSNPVNFQEKILIAQRRKWGIILLGVLSFLGTGLFLLTWLAGDWLKNGLGQITAWILTNVPGLGVFVEGWKWFVEKWILLTHLKTGIELLWQQYAYSIMGIILVWVVFEGMRGKMMFKER